MKILHYIYLLFSVMTLFFSSCRFAQVLYVDKANSTTVEKAGFWTYENDTMKVVYNFWAEHGIMAFVIENKLNIPIYIDWKKSNFIANNVSFPYYTESETKTFTSTTKSYSSTAILNWATMFNGVVSEATGSATSIKEERISFIAPHAHLFKSEYVLFPADFVDMKESAKKEISLVDSLKHSKAYVLTTSLSNAKIVFRNFLTYSTKESFEQENYVDNMFFARKVLMVKKSVFWGNYKFFNGREYESPYEDPRRFYLNNIGSGWMVVPK